MTISRVRAGDLITAERFNSLIQALEDMDLRLRTLELAMAQQHQVLAVYSPTEGTAVRAGDVFDVTGANFGFSQGALRVWLDGQPAGYTAASDTQFTLTAPSPVGGVPAEGRTMYLRVNNGASEVSRALRLTQRQGTTGGFIDLALGTISPNPITPGGRAVFPFTLNVETILPGTTTFNITTAVTGVVPAPVVQILSATDAPLPSNQLVVEPGSRNVPFRVVMPTAPDANARFELAVTAAATDPTLSLTTTERIAQTVGVPQVNFVEVSMTDATQVTVSPQGVVGVRRGGQRTVALSLRFNAPGTYLVAVGAEAGTSPAGWTFTLARTLSGTLGTGPQQYTVPTDAPVAPALGIRAVSATTIGATARLVISVTRTSDSRVQTIAYSLEAIA
jgi:hypothetical protein